MLINQMQLTIYRSLISTDSLKKIVSESYNLNGSIKVSLLSIGDNDHYLVSTKDNKYVLRIYKHNKHWLQKESDYLFEMDWLTFLRNNNLPVSYPIQRKDGRYIDTLIAPEGIRYWALFSLAQGEIKKLNDKRCYKYGEVIAKLHIASNKFKPFYKDTHQIDQNFLINLPIQQISDFFQDARNEYIILLKSLATKLELKIKNFEKVSKHDAWGVIGGDFHIKNFFYNNNNEITLFDFDHCGYGWRAYDLAIFKWSLFVSFNKGGKVKNDFHFLWKSFLAGYETYR